MGDEPVVVTTADRSEDVRMILYGLRLRGIPATARPARRGTRDPWEIVTDPAFAARAHAAIGVVWDAVFESARAVTEEGKCPFCGYSVLGVPDDHPCPECGVDLRSVEARRAFRDGAGVKRGLGRRPG